MIIGQGCHGSVRLLLPLIKLCLFNGGIGCALSCKTVRKTDEDISITRTSFHNMMPGFAMLG